MSGVRATKGISQKGSATVEAAIALPVFLVVIFSLVYIIRIFFTYNTIQASLNEVARRIGNMSYFYHISGLKDYSDQLNDAAGQSEETLQNQKNTIIDAFGSFNETIMSINGASNSKDISDDAVQNIIDKAGEFEANLGSANELIETVLSDPKQELRLFMTIFAQKLSYGITNRLVCLIAKGDLASELDKRVGKSGGDAARALGVKNGANGLDFSQSSVFGDNESLELIVNYSVKAPVPFGLIPELKLSNRVKIIAWTGGRGQSVKMDDEKAEGEGSTTGSSIWTQMDQDNRYWDRGLEIEDLHVEKLIGDSSQENSLQAFATPKDYSVVDMYTYYAPTGSVVLYDVFTLNPFSKTYSQNKSAVAGEIKKHGRRLLEFEEMPEGLKDYKIETVKRVVILIIPENSEAFADEAYEAAKAYLDKYGVEVQLVKAYGEYVSQENQELAEAS